MRNDHYISRFLTEPWEVGQRVLHFYDFQSDNFGEISSRSLFAQQGLHSRETDRFINKFVETLVATYVHSLTNQGDPPQPDGPTGRVLIAFWALQSHRVGDARFPGLLSMTLDEFLAGGEPILDRVEREVRATQDIIVVRTNQSLFFPEAGTSPIPLRRGPMLIALPLTPHHFLAFAGKSRHPWKPALEALLRDRITITALSVGVGPNVHRVVLLPESIPADAVRKARAKESLKGFRRNSRLYVEMVSAENQMLGLDHWDLLKP